MKIERPQFELTRVFSDGSKEAPEIMPVTQLPWDTQMNRRGFLGVGVGAAAVVCLLDGEAAATDLFGNSEGQSQSAAAPAKVPEKTLLAHESDINGLAVTPDGKTLVSISNDSTFKLWSLPNGRLLLRRKVPAETYINSLAITANGKTLVTGLDNNTARVWSLPGGLLLASIRGHAEPVKAVAVTPDGKIVATGDGNGVLKIWTWPARRLLAKLEGNQLGVASLAVTPDGATLISGDGEGKIRLWSLAERKLMNSFGNERSLNAFVVSTDGRTMISASHDKGISLWSLPEGELLKTLQPRASNVLSLALTPDGQTLISGSSDDKIHLWSLPEGKLVETLEGHQSNVSALAVTPDGKWLISADSSGVMLIWDFENRSFRSFLFDRAANDRDVKGVSYNVYDKLTGQMITYTLPCGSPIPRGAVCTCNCVRGSYVEPSYGGGGGFTYCSCNKICTCIPISDRNVKEAFETTDPLLILQRLSELPIQTWNYKWNDSAIRHIGPMAQDFAAAFCVGEDDKHICPVDAQGVAFAAIQGLYQMVCEKDAQTESLQAQLQRQEAENQALHARVEALEQLVKDVLGVREEVRAKDRLNRS